MTRTPSSHAPPRAAELLLRILLPRTIREVLLADLAEAYARPGRRQRVAWYWGQAARACWPPTLLALYAQERSSEERMVMPEPTSILEILRYDGRLALRGFRRRPLFTAMIVTTLALGVGANATMFGIIDRVYFEAPPHIANPDRVALLSFGTAVDNYSQTAQPYVVKTALEREVSDFDGVAVATMSVGHRQYFPVGRGAVATRVAGGLVSANYFSLLGVKPLLGRFFMPEEEVESNAPRSVVLGYGYWKRRYAGSRDVIGETIPIGPNTYTVVGVAPRGFTGTEMRDVDVWLPIAGAEGLRFDSSPDWATSTNSQWLLVLARLKPGVTEQHAAAQAGAAYRALMRTSLKRPTPALLAYYDSTGVSVGSIIPGKSRGNWGLSGSSGGAAVSTMLGGVALMVLLIACANVANLLLVRALGRRREIAVRLALGVSRRRLVAQLVVEGVLLSSIGTIVAFGIAALASPFLRTWLIGDGAWSDGVLGVRTLTFTGTLGVLTGVATSLVPALEASRLDVSSSLKAGAREGSIQRSRTRTVLLVAQASLAILLLSGAGTFIRSLRNVAGLDLGIDRDHVALVSFTPAVLSMSLDETRALFDRFAERARTIPGVASTAVTIGLPFSLSWNTRVYTPGRDVPRLRNPTVQYGVTPAYFDVLGIHSLLGRSFTSSDRMGGAPVAIVNETMARLYWPNQSPVGACIKIGADSMPCTTVVGVVTNTRRQDLVEGLVPQLYRPLDQLTPEQSEHTVDFFGYTLVVRSAGDASTIVEPLRRAVQGTSGAVPYANVQTMNDLLGRHTRSWVLGARVFTAFGALALLLAGIGIFSIVAFTIGQRMHEFGVRAALGASGADILRLTLARGIAPAAAGIVVGIALTLVAARFVESLVFQVSARDPITLGIASAVMLVCAVVAAFVPAMRATRVDPTIALRSE
ncbi:MAG TPA: ADOP family duplicated permease [Gemmatimonadaceae bacterium]|nr:ADOP family duplicated permease [Gemmatimonadaceae bacterium]